MMVRRDGRPLTPTDVLGLFTCVLQFGCDCDNEGKRFEDDGLIVDDCDNGCDTEASCWEYPLCHAKSE